MPKKALADTGNRALPDAAARHLDRGHRGARNQTGEQLAIVEAMKMENVLRAERDATVKKVHVNRARRYRGRCR